jgi:hypothetical protein
VMMGLLTAAGNTWSGFSRIAALTAASHGGIAPTLAPSSVRLARARHARRSARGRPPLCALQAAGPISPKGLA